MLLKGVVAVLATLYPFAVYFGLYYFSPRVIAASLLCLMSLRLLVLRKALMMQTKALLVPTVLAMAVAAAAVVSGVGEQLTIMPVVINFGFFIVFSYSLLSPPSMVEILAKIQEPDLTEAGVIYTKKVTFAWCILFLCLGAVSLYTHFLGDMKIWMLFNGFIAYLLIGFFAGVELLIRQRVKASHLPSVDLGAE